MFQVISFIFDIRIAGQSKPSAVSPDPSPHEALDELPLEQQETDQEWSRRHQRRGADYRPVDALIGGREDLQPHGQWPRFDRVGDDQRPKEVVPVETDRYEAV